MIHRPLRIAFTLGILTSGLAAPTWLMATVTDDALVNYKYSYQWPLRTPWDGAPSVTPDEHLDQSASTTMTPLSGPGSPLTVGSGCTFATLQDAIDAAASGDTIRVANETWTGDDATANINDMNLTVTGGYDSTCTSIMSTNTVLDGTGMSFADTIIEVSHTSGSMTLTLENLALVNGEDDTNDGGGLEVSGLSAGSTTITLNRVALTGSQSDLGAGIHVTDATLLIDQQSVLDNNNATDAGGGIWCSGADITIQGGSFIGFFAGNTAIDNPGNNFGGGFYLDNCDLVLGGADGTTAVTVVLNESEKGGGIYATNGSRIDLHGDQARIQSNLATRGGGVYLDGGSELYNDNGWIVENTAVEGGGFFITGAGTLFDYDRNNSYPCTGRCNRLSDNTAETAGAGLIEPGAKADIRSSWVAGNSASQDSIAFESFGDLELHSVMLIDQQAQNFAASLLQIKGGATVIAHSTIAGTTLDGTINTSLIRLSGAGSEALDLNNSIVWGNDPDYSDLVVTTSGQTTMIDNNILELPAGPGNFGDDPLFLDPGNDYHISPVSPAVDIADTTNVPDIDKEDRDFGAGTDLGADEALRRVGVAASGCVYQRVSEAIAVASTGNTIYISPGVYLETLGAIDKSLTFVPATANCDAEDMTAFSQSVTINGQSNFESRGGLVLIEEGNVVFRHMTLTDAQADFGGIVHVQNLGALILDDADVSGGIAQQYGGGIRTWGDTELVNGSAVYSNAASSILRGSTAGFAQSGAGVAVGASGSLTVSHNSFIGGFGGANVAQEAGGGIYVDGGVVNIRDTSAVLANEAAAGGGIFATGNATVLIEDDAVVGGTTATAGNSADFNGGGIVVASSTLQLWDNARISFNSAANGGGISVLGDALIDGIGGLVEQNSALMSGGGIHAATSAGSNPDVLLTGTQVRANDALNGGGIAANANGDGALVLNEATIANNQATSGGGVHVSSSGVLPQFELHNTDITANTATGSGGGIAVLSDTQLAVQDGSAVSMNTADSNGGGIVLAGGASVTVDGAELAFNTATNGSGGAIYSDSASSSVVITSLNGSVTRLLNNLAPNGNGGGVFVANGFLGTGTDMPGLAQTVYQNNSAVNGGAIYLDSAGAEPVGNLLFDGNFASDRGGAFFATGAETGLAAIGGDRPRFVSNEAAGAGGGAINIEASPRVDLVDLEVGAVNNGNTASSGQGGGIRLIDVTESYLVNLDVRHNSADSGGGGLYVDGGAILIDAFMPGYGYPGSLRGAQVVNPCEPAALSANEYCSQWVANDSTLGAGMRVGGGTSIAIRHTAIRGINNGDTGIRGDNAVDFSMSQSLMSDHGGIAALWLAGINTSADIDFSTFAGNDAGAPINMTLTSGSSINVDRTIVWGNQNDNDIALAVNGVCNFSQDGSLPGSTLDPQFATTARGDFRLADTSPAVDACAIGANSYDLDDGERPSQPGTDYDPGAFERAGPPPVTLTLALDGTGDGIVTGSPGGITCPGDCTEAYPPGTAVTLTATAAGGSDFDGWSNCPNPSGNTCSLTLNAATTITATFTDPDVLFRDGFEP